MALKWYPFGFFCPRSDFKSYFVSILKPIFKMIYVSLYIWGITPILSYIISVDIHITQKYLNQLCLTY